jgi:NAD(P)-dependent dehydrogenase (short-subunit alcohol dehydrogenase family)
MNEPSSTAKKDAEAFGLALFNNESHQQWTDLYSVNTFSIFYVTTAFLGLLAKGSEDKLNYTSCVINITSISGLSKSEYLFGLLANLKLD